MEMPIIREIRAYLKETGHNAYQLSKAAGLDGSTVSHILNKSSSPRGETTTKLRERMTFVRAEIAARLEAAAKKGAAAGRAS